MGRAGRQLAETEFQIEKIIKKHLDIYEELISNKITKQLNLYYFLRKLSFLKIKKIIKQEMNKTKEIIGLINLKET